MTTSKPYVLCEEEVTRQFRQTGYVLVTTPTIRYNLTSLHRENKNLVTKGGENKSNKWNSNVRDVPLACVPITVIIQEGKKRDTVATNLHRSPKTEREREAKAHFFMATVAIMPGQILGL